MSLEKSGNTARIAANSFWLGLEMAFDIVSGLVTTFILARTFGPERLGYFNYVMWLTTLSGAIGSLGLPLTCRKYMAEFLGQGRPEMARAIFEYSFRRHALLSVLVTLFGVTMVFTLSDPLWRTVSLLQVLSVLPGMLRHVPSQANMAAENLKANVPGSIIGQSCHVGGVLLCIALGWDLAGIAASMFAARARTGRADDSGPALDQASACRLAAAGTGDPVQTLRQRQHFDSTGAVDRLGSVGHDLPGAAGRIAGGDLLLQRRFQPNRKGLIGPDNAGKLHQRGDVGSIRTRS